MKRNEEQRFFREFDSIHFKEFRAKKKKISFFYLAKMFLKLYIYRSLSTFDLNRTSRNLVVGQIFEKDSYLGEVRYTRESLNSLDARQSDPTFRENRQVAVSKHFPRPYDPRLEIPFIERFPFLSVYSRRRSPYISRFLLSAFEIFKVKPPPSPSGVPSSPLDRPEFSAALTRSRFFERETLGYRSTKLRYAISLRILEKLELNKHSLRHTRFLRSFPFS